MRVGPMPPSTRIDLTAPEVVADPYPFFAEERLRHPVAWYEPGGSWLVFDHAGVDAVLRDRRFGRLWTDREPRERLEPFNLLHRNQMMENEPPDHTRLRRLVAGAFARGHVERLRPRVRELAAGLLDRVDPAGFDVVGEYAEPLPVLVVAELLGVPTELAPRLRAWSQAIVRMYEVEPTREVEDAAVRAAEEFAATVRELARERAASPRDDLVSDLVAARAPSGDGTPARLTEDEVVASAVLLLNAGHEASVNVFGNGLVAMLRRGLRPDPDRTDLCVEEMLRFDPALQLFERTATRRRDRRRGHRRAGAEGRGAARRREPRPRGLRRPRHLPDHPRPQPAPGLRGRAALLPRRAAGPDGARRVRRPALVPAARPAAGRGPRPARDLRAAGPHPGARRLLTTSGTTGQRRGTMAERHDAVEVITAKRDGGELGDAQIDWVIDAYTRGAVADEQMAALAMAILLNGMNRREVARWTRAMIASGERMDFSALSRPTADKHSTGGVGDKITLPLAPLVAACGVAVPQLSGRGLGHTGGTLDKLESIPGWRADLGNDEMMRQLEDVGAVICAAGAGLAPADKKLYALRDVTATVEAIPLIASSIMSKKIAEGTGALVLDVKVGSGAFMKDLDRARELAETMVALGTDAGVRTVALLTDMSTPLGRTAGNALEVRESVDVLAGGGPADVVELTLALAREMLTEAGVTGVDPADRLADGSAMDTWRRMVRAQGGDPEAPLPTAQETHVVTAPATGTLTRLDAMAVGLAAWRLGAGRARKEDPVQAGAGVEMHAKPGDTVTEGQPLLTLHTDEPERFERALDSLDGGYDIGDGASYAPTPLVLDRVAAG